MAEDGTNTAHSEARRMLDIFASVGASTFNLTWTNSAGDPRRSHKGMSVAEITRAMPKILDAATGDRLNVIVRPYGTGVWFHSTGRPHRRQTGQTASQPPRPVSHSRNLARQLSGMACDSRQARQGICPQGTTGSGSRCYRERRNARCRKPELQGQIRARFSARDDPRGSARPESDSRRA